MVYQSVTKFLSVIMIFLRNFSLVEYKICLLSKTCFSFRGISSIFLSNYQFDAPVDNPSLRQYCVQVPGGASPTLHNCHFTNTSFCGACVYVHGAGARPHVTHCTIANANNVGVFVDDHAHVSLLSNILRFTGIVAVVSCVLLELWL